MPGILGILSSDPVGNFIPFLIIVAALVISITVHEFAHGWAADKLGDPTPRYKNRVTLNPLAHLDPIGSLAILFIGFGWGKPVPFDPYNLKDPIKDAAKIAIAGPASNILLAVLFSLLATLNSSLGLAPIGLVNTIATILVNLNVMLAIFTLVPIHPLDGGKVLLAFLPKTTALEYDHFMHRYGTFVLLLLILPLAGGSSPVSQLISPIISFISRTILLL
jgi:Zn-dependent protease